MAAAGGKDELVRRSGNRVSVRTLDNWTAGRYPPAKITGAVRDLDDAWALAHVPGYPVAAGAPRLIDGCGPRPPAPAVVPESPAPASQPPRRRWLRWAVPLAVIALIAVAAVVVRQVTGDDPLPTHADGDPVPQQTGGIGANTFADPVKLQDNAMGIPPDTTVPVRCRFYAPSIPSVEPDGYWYLIDSGKWGGRWAPANSFMNGDVPGQPTLHNTDLAVPVCD